MTSIVRTALHSDDLNIGTPKIQTLDQPDFLSGFQMVQVTWLGRLFENCTKVLISDILTWFSEDWSGFWTTLWNQIIRNRTALEPFKWGPHLNTWLVRYSEDQCQIIKNEIKQPLWVFANPNIFMSMSVPSRVFN